MAPTVGHSVSLRFDRLLSLVAPARPVGIQARRLRDRSNGPPIPVIRLINYKRDSSRPTARHKNIERPWRRVGGAGPAPGPRE